MSLISAVCDIWYQDELVDIIKFMYRASSWKVFFLLLDKLEFKFTLCQLNRVGCHLLTLHNKKCKQLANCHVLGTILGEGFELKQTSHGAFYFEHFHLNDGASMEVDVADVDENLKWKLIPRMDANAHVTRLQRTHRNQLKLLMEKFNSHQLRSCRMRSWLPVSSGLN
jgi:hypothetical protein